MMSTSYARPGRRRSEDVAGSGGQAWPERLRRRWRAVERALLRLLLLLSERESGVGSEKERSAAGKVKARQEGAGQAGAAARRASPAHGGHAVSAP